MKRILSFLAAVFAMALPVEAANEEIVAGLSSQNVAITATFVGSEILIFGAIKREAPAPDSDLGVVVVVEGPSQHITVRRKAHVMGIWVNTDAVEIASAPSFYAVATSGPLASILDEAVDRANNISIPEAIRGVDATHVPDPEAFAEAVVRIREKSDLYQFDEGAVTLSSDTLFDTRIKLPANLTEGSYKARIYLTRDGQLVANHIANIEVSKVGIERWIYNLAHNQPILYGLMSLAIAIAAGWGASTAFRKLLRN